VIISKIKTEQRMDNAKQDTVLHENPPGVRIIVVVVSVKLKAKPRICAHHRALWSRPWEAFLIDQRYGCRATPAPGSCAVGGGFLICR